MSDLAHSLRPTTQNPEALVGPASQLWQGVLKPWREGHPFHTVLWGPPGCGKTTLAMMLGEISGLTAVFFSAVKDSTKDLKNRPDDGKKIFLFVDEIHRLNKAQQDVLLPLVERGNVLLVGATTENPRSCLNPALLSRVRTLYCNPPEPADMIPLLKRGLAYLNEKNFKTEKKHIEDMLSTLATSCSHDPRQCLNTLEMLYHASTIQEEQLILRGIATPYSSKDHTVLVSAFIKSMRGSDPDAALFYGVLCLDNGEDPLFLLRRCIIFASEDVGNADPQALSIAVNAYTAVEKVGLPEGAIPFAQCVTYLASTVKSNRSYLALHTVRKWAQEAPAREAFEPPPSLTPMGKGLYKYPHDEPSHFLKMEYLPKYLAQLKERFGPAYQPSHQGFEARIQSRLAQLWANKKDPI